MPLSEKESRHLSKFMSLVLRHQPEVIGLSLDHEGWAQVNELIEKMNAHQTPVTIEQLEEVVASSDKQRFAFDITRTKIRANQGHSVQVDLHFESQPPPDFLFHGTAVNSVESIFATGLHKGNRLHVHLSPDEETAIVVGKRHGKPVVLKVHAGEMHRAGFPFFRSANGVWLTEHVPPQFLFRVD